VKKLENWNITTRIPWQNERNFSAKSIFSQLLTDCRNASAAAAAPRLCRQGQSQQQRQDPPGTTEPNYFRPHSMRDYR
jgi:hypothetical protein